MSAGISRYKGFSFLRIIRKEMLASISQKSSANIKRAARWKSRPQVVTVC